MASWLSRGYAEGVQVHLAVTLVLAACAARAQSEPAQTIAAYEPPPGMQWVSPACRRVPCQLAPDPNQDPIKPFKNQEELKKAMRDQEDITGPGSAVDLGDGRYAVKTGNGKAVIGGLCDGSSCSGMPLDMSSIPGLQAKFDARSAEDAAQGGTALLNPDRPSAGAARPGYEDGRSVASMFDIGGQGAPRDADGQEIIDVDGDAAVGKHDGFTFIMTARNAALLPKFRPKKGDVFALPGEIPDPDAGAPAVPPLTRAERNDD